VVVIVLGIFAKHAFQQRLGFGRTFLSQQALAEVCARINILPVALHGSAITGLRLIEFAALEINVAEFRVMTRVVEVMNLRFEFLDAATALRTGQFKPARRRVPEHVEEIPGSGEAGHHDHVENPHPLTTTSSVYYHPEIEQADDAEAAKAQPVSQSVKN